MYKREQLMAWNEPGDDKSKNKDAWGKANKDGPPDLEEVFIRLQKKLFALFGGGNGSNSNGGNLGMGSLLPLIIVSIIAYVFIGFYVISPYEQGVVTRFGRYVRKEGDGLHWHPRFIENVRKINTENLDSSSHSGWMLTKDENILFVEIELQFRILDAEKYLFNAVEPRLTLKEAADSALRQVIGNSNTDDVLTDKKQKIVDSIYLQLNKILKNYDIGYYIASLNFKNSSPPEQVKDAFDDVTKSREDRERLKLKADAYYNKIVPEAEGMAKKIILEAEGYKQEKIMRAEGETSKFSLVLPEYLSAPGVTRSRMYLDTMQDIFVKVPKVLIDVKEGNNVIYLPIDRLQLKSTTNKNIVSLNTTSEDYSKQNYTPNQTDEVVRKRRKG